ncbi:hypothetical protein [Faecalimicrobium sp. JNUCC 81]
METRSLKVTMSKECKYESQCPECEEWVRLKETGRGLEGICKECGQSFTVVTYRR